MGHANVSNLSHAFIKQIYANGKVTMKQVAEHCIKNKIFFQASEGEYQDEGMIRFGLTWVVLWHLGDVGGAKLGPEKTIEPILDESWAQDAWKEFEKHGFGTESEFHLKMIEEEIQFRFTPGTRAKYQDEGIGHVSNVES